MASVIERYTLDLLARPAAPVVVLKQQLGDVAVHWHDFYELVLVVDGESVHTANGYAHVVSSGSSMLLSPTDFHGFRLRSAGPLVCFNVVIDPLVAERHLGPLLGQGSSRPWAVEQSASGPAFERLWVESQERRPGAEQVMDALLACILVDLAREVRDAGPRPVAQDDLVRRALFHLDRHFREPLTLAEVAASVHLSPNYFSERFHAATGMVFQAYLQQSRLRFARSLLAASDVSVTEAALAAGFSSSSHFARAYRARYGRSPTDDRGRRRGERG